MNLLGGLALGLSGVGDLGAVFVGPRGHQDLISLHAFEPPYGVGRNSGIGVPDMRGRIHVVNGSGQIVFHQTFFRYAQLAAVSISCNGIPFSRANFRQSSYSGGKSAVIGDFYSDLAIWNRNLHNFAGQNPPLSAV